jgi:hypothetical protein
MNWSTWGKELVQYFINTSIASTVNSYIFPIHRNFRKLWELRKGKCIYLTGQNFPVWVNFKFSSVLGNYIYKNIYSLCGGRYFVILTKHHFLIKRHRKFSRLARFDRLVLSFPTTRAKLPGIASQSRLPFVGGFPYGRGLSPLVGSRGYLYGEKGNL